MTNTGLIGKQTLSDQNITQVRGLESACLEADGVRVKFNWGLMRDRDTAGVGNFGWHEEGRLVGYAQTDGEGDECEVTGAVLPMYRKRGIFRRLFEAARTEARRQGDRPLLLVSYPRCPAGTAAARRFGTVFRFSEYRLEADAAVPPLPRSALRLRETTPADVAELSRTIGLSFEGARWNGPDALLRALQTPGRRYFLAEVGPETVGQIGAVVPPEGGVYLRAVGILPERRRRGYGRQMLAALVHRLIGEGHERFALDVATNNAQALGLYQACGFRETMAYDYSDVPAA